MEWEYWESSVACFTKSTQERIVSCKIVIYPV